MLARIFGFGLAVGLPAIAAAQAPQPAPAPAPIPAKSAAPTTPAPVTVHSPAAYGDPLLGDPCAPACPAACCDVCGPPGRVWVSAEWLYWAASGNPLPVLATGSPAGTPLANAGVQGVPGTTTLIGGNRANNDFRSGFRLNAGVWLDECQTCGIEGDFFFLGNSSDGATAGSPAGSPGGVGIVSRPFFNALTGRNDAQLVSFPGIVAGTVTTNSSSDVIGGGIGGVRNLCCGPCGRVDLTGGFRYLNLQDDVTITENLSSLGGTGVAPGTSIIVRDRFQTSNDFYGTAIGLRAERRYGMCYVMVRSSIAFGVTHQTVTISGSTTTTPPGGVPTTLPGGLYAQGSNIGSYSRDAFAVIPEFGLRVGAQVTDHARVFVGYNYLYWSDVARAGDQIDRRVNPNQIPPTVPGGPALPAVLFKTTDYWLQGVSVGGEFRF